LGKFKGNIVILNNNNLFCRKFATVFQNSVGLSVCQKIAIRTRLVFNPRRRCKLLLVPLKLVCFDQQTV